MSFLPSGPELLILLVIAAVLLGPERLPEYTRTLIDFVKKARAFYESSRSTVESEMGVTVDDLKRYDPRQYDPRRIVREAWASSATNAGPAVSAGGSAEVASIDTDDRDPDMSGPETTPFDDEAT